MKHFIFIIVFVVCFAVPCSAEHNKTYGDFTGVEYLRNYDGDTITFNIPGVHPLLGENISIRVDGIDTPEIKGSCDQEKILAQKAKIFAEEILKHAEKIDLKNVGRGKYFRITAAVQIDGLDLGQELIKRGFAVAYDGGTKIKNWCE